MTAFAIATPYPVILALNGAGLNGGQVYIGLPNQDPQSFPQAVYWDAASTIPASQPLTVTGGYVTRSGTPATPYVAGYYSIRVLNAQGALVFYDAAVGPIGQYVSSTVLQAAAVSLTTGVTANVTSISLTAGDWDLWGNVITGPAGATQQQALFAAISTVSATLPTPPGAGAYSNAFYPNLSNAMALSAGKCALQLGAATTVYLLANSSFTVSTNGAYGFLGARRAA